MAPHVPCQPSCVLHSSTTLPCVIHCVMLFASNALSCIFSRDIKLENAMLHKEGDGLLLKLTDFSYAKSNIDSSPRSSVGTRNYAGMPGQTLKISLGFARCLVIKLGFDSTCLTWMGLPENIRECFCGKPFVIDESVWTAAPEVITSDQKQYDGKQADVWSCGVFLYACLFCRSAACHCVVIDGCSNAT